MLFALFEGIPGGRGRKGRGEDERDTRCVLCCRAMGELQVCKEEISTSVINAHETGLKPKPKRGTTR